MSKFDLKARLLLKAGALTKWFPVDLRPDSGWEVELAFLTKEGFERMVKKHTRRVYVEASNDHIAKLDKVAFYGELTDKIIMNWKGLTVGVLKTLVAFNTDGLKDSEEVTFSRDTCVLILQHSVGFDNWVADIASMPGRFQNGVPDEESGLGNSSPTPSGS